MQKQHYGVLKYSKHVWLLTTQCVGSYTPTEINKYSFLDLNIKYIPKRIMENTLDVL